MTKKVFTREEKIKYYQRKTLNLEYALEKARERLHFIMSDEYQEWNSELQKQLDIKKAR